MGIEGKKFHKVDSAPKHKTVLPNISLNRQEFATSGTTLERSSVTIPTHPAQVNEVNSQKPVRETNIEPKKIVTVTDRSLPKRSLESSMRESPFSKIERDGLPNYKINIEQTTGELKPVSRDLALEVISDIKDIKTKILSRFGGNKLPLDDIRIEQIGDFFAANKWSVPQFVVIDPIKDAEELRSILAGAKFRSPESEEFFTGANGSLISPGCSVVYDLAVLHDIRERAKGEIGKYIDKYKVEITPKDLDIAVEQRMTDLVVHEFSHLAGSLSGSAIVLKKVHGNLILSGRGTSGFIDIEDNVSAPGIGENDIYYSGPALDEGWAALNSSRFAFFSKGVDRTSVPIKNRYYIDTNVTLSSGKQVTTGVTGLSSCIPGMVVEKLDEQFGGIIPIMDSVANGSVTLSGGLQNIKDLVPSEVYRLLLDPNFNSWQKLYKKVKLKK